ncbi:hypothetical protein JCM10003_612 [Bacteroides pyogenes JCM 10003]|nr:hypothetical protein JCM10003_612 [Bacteroides pyogenes JCM 10003]
MNVQFGIKTACHTINRDADKNRVTAIDFLLVLFHKEKNGKCTGDKMNCVKIGVCRDTLEVRCTGRLTAFVCL